MNNPNEICPHEKCVGCKVCFSVCHHNAITFHKDVLGFEYPVINMDRCIDCGACRKVCPVNNPVEKKFPKKCFASAVSKEEELLASSSGGLANYMATTVLSKGGVVYGASNEDMQHVHHKRIDSICNLDTLRGSKYVQSDMANIASEVLHDLKSGLKVLFTGTPCQVAGLKSFLRHDYDNLITVDLVCHGVPSQQLLNDNIKAYADAGCDIAPNSVRFRAKKQDRTGCFSIQFGWFYKTNRTGLGRSIPSEKDSYLFGFENALFYRECCYNCSYSYSSRVGDITLCDFWGLGNVPELTKGKGVSAVLINTEKGDAFFKSLDSDKMISVEREIKEAICGNGNLMRPSSKHPQHDRFIMLYPQIGWVKATKLCLKKTHQKIRLMKILNIVRRKIGF